MLRFKAIMDESNEPVLQDPAPEAPAEPAPEITSRFLFVDVAALRAKQIRRGAQIRYREGETPVTHKAERVAMEEVRRGLVFYDIPGGDGKPAADSESPAGPASTRS
jgi:DNA-directed RNA polymerase subunit K/omega